ncbi:MAG: VanZ family protein [Butyrivibrio sp.]|nr:VanZ family protein [Butyrivibrio sp.]
MLLCGHLAGVPDHRVDQAGIYQPEAGGGPPSDVCQSGGHYPFPFAVRASDVDDLILNVLGVTAGCGIYAAVKQLRGS